MGQLEDSGHPSYPGLPVPQTSPLPQLDLLSLLGRLQCLVSRRCPVWGPPSQASPAILLVLASRAGR